MLSTTLGACLQRGGKLSKPVWRFIYRESCDFEFDYEFTLVTTSIATFVFVFFTLINARKLCYHLFMSEISYIGLSNAKTRRIFKPYFQ